MKKPKNIKEVMGYLGSIKTNKKAISSRKNLELGRKKREKNNLDKAPNG